MIARFIKGILPRRTEAPVSTAVAQDIMGDQMCTKVAVCAFLGLDPNASIFAPLRTVHFSRRTLERAKEEGAILIPVVASLLTLHKKGFWHFEGEAPNRTTLNHQAIYVGSLKTPRWVLIRPDGKVLEKAVLHHQQAPRGRYVPDAREFVHAHVAYLAMGHRATFVQGLTYTGSTVVETHRMLFDRSTKWKLKLRMVPMYHHGTFALPHAWNPISQP